MFSAFSFQFVFILVIGTKGIYVSIRVEFDTDAPMNTYKTQKQL